ncbi:MAG: radical SAM protein [bacterium]
MLSKEKGFVLQGLDHFSKQEIKEFWEGWEPKNDKPKILGVGLSCTFRCNLKCVYCYAGDKEPLPDELTLEEQKSIITQAKKLGAETVIICGDAEPLMDKNLLGIVEHGYRNEITCVVVSNGISLGDDKLAMNIHGMKSKEVASTLYNLGSSLVIKMESITSELYNQIVGVKDAYRKFMQAVNNIMEVGFGNGIERESDILTRVCFSSVVMVNNIDELPAMKEFANQRNAQYICKLPSLVGRALENLEMMFPVSRYEEIRRHLSKFTAKRETLMVDTPRCMAWHYGPVIDIRGEIRECYTSPCNHQNRIGNIREKSLEELLKRRNTIYDITINDFCPVKTRINRELEAKGLHRIWDVESKDRL